MKKNLLFKNCRNVAFVITTITSVTILCSCSFASKATTSSGPEREPTVALAHLNPQPDSTTVAILGEDVANVIFGAKKATLSKLNPYDSIADSDDTIGRIKVVSSFGTLNKTDLITLQFLMADSEFYYNGSTSNTTRNAPQYAISFTKGKPRVDLLFSLVSMQMDVVVDGETTISIKYYNNARQVTRFFRLVTQNEFYDRIIENQ